MHYLLRSETCGNPNDKIHIISQICKIVSSSDEELLFENKSIYDLKIKVGTYPVSSIRATEAIKVTKDN